MTVSAARRALFLAACVLALGLALRASLEVAAFSVTSPRFPDYDAATRGLAGLRMADAIHRGDLPALAGLVHRSTVWPPLVPLLEALVFLPCGATVGTAVAFMVAWLALLLIAAFAAGLALGGARGALTGAIAISLLASSPYVLGFGSLVMLEVPGAALTLAAAGLAIAWRRTGRAAAGVGTCVALLLLFFLKYNYALMMIVPLAIHEMGHVLPEARTLLRRVRGLRPGWFTGGILAWLVVIAILAFRGPGWGYGPAVAGKGRGLSVPLLVLAALLVGRVLISPSRSVRAWRDGWRAMGPGLRTFSLVVVLPAALWLASPSHVKGLINFSVNRSGVPGEAPAHGWLLYPRWFLERYAPDPVAGGLVLALAAASLVWLRGRTVALRLVPLAAWFGFAVCEIHPFKSSRFLFTVAVLLALAAAMVTAALLERAARRVMPRVADLALLIVACVVPAVTAASSLPVAGARRVFESWTANPAIGPVLDDIAGELRAGPGLMVLGTSNELSPGLIEWHARRLDPAIPTDRRPGNPEWYGARGGEAMASAMARDSSVRRVIALEIVTGGSENRERQETQVPWLPAARASIASAPEFALERERTFPASGYRVRVYTKRAPAPGS